MATPHFETELELMADLLDEGHDVVVIRCSGQLSSCLVNPEHLPSMCLRCRSKMDDGFARVRHPRLKIEEIDPGPIDARLQRRFSSTEELKLYCLDGVNLGRGACASTCAQINKDTKLDAEKHAELIWRELSAAYQVHMGVRRAIERHRPDRVYVFNGRFATCYPVVLACRAMGVEFYTHDRGATIAHYLLRKNTLPHDLGVIHDEMMELWAQGGPDRERVASEWFEGRRAGAEPAGPSYIKSQIRGRLPDGFDPARRNIAIFNSTIEEYDTIVQDTFLYPDEVVGLRHIVESMKGVPDTRLWLRVHPNLKNIPRDDNYQLRAYAELDRQHDHLTVIWPESDVHSYTLMERATLSLTFGSTIGVEAAYWGHPSVLAGRASYERIGCCHVPSDHDELVGMLRQDLPTKGRASSLPYGYWESTRGTLYKRFQPIGFFGGTYEGREIKTSATTRARAIAMRLLGR
jgi:hypothetical protein